MSNHIYPQHYTYEIRNKESGLRYIGVRSCDCNPHNDSYFGTCKTLDESIATEGIENFIKTILQTFDTREEAMQHEIDLHELYDVAKNPLFYNRSKATSVGFYCDNTGNKHTEESKKKMSETRKGQVPWNKGHKLDEEMLKKWSEVQVGRKLSEEHKKNITWSAGQHVDPRVPKSDPRLQNSQICPEA